MGLKAGDLKNMVNRVFEIDSYKSKMGNDADIVVLSFTVNEQAPAKDLVDFIERGYNFVLDADVSSGEQDDGYYRVYVEIERDENVPAQVMELMDGIVKLTDQSNYKFRYYKSFQSNELTLESLEEAIPLDPSTYDEVVTESNMNNFKNFFNKSFLEISELNEDDELTLKKSWADPIGFAVKDFGKTTDINETLEKINMNDYSEILFLTKYIGDYNVMKFGKKTLTFENKGYTLVLERL
tara:strand:+ start:54 stop:770 length:717 start_codon:yes stop_codon:yes gene_type:complete